MPEEITIQTTCSPREEARAKRRLKNLVAAIKYFGSCGIGLKVNTTSKKYQLEMWDIAARKLRIPKSELRTRHS